MNLSFVGRYKQLYVDWQVESELLDLSESLTRQETETKGWGGQHDGQLATDQTRETVLSQVYMLSIIMEK